MESTHKPIVVIAGGSGFVGRALGRALGERFHVIGLSRRSRTEHADASESGFSQWRKADMFNLRETEEALEGARYAIYLVHSMLPSARLTQAEFADLDLVCADNFARAAKKAHVEQIVYLSGLSPDDETLSPHLRSRGEVERTLGRYGVPVTTLRAGMVLGGGGSSFEMMVRLVERLPAMICPRWTLHRMQPISVHDVITLLTFCVGNPECLGQRFDVGASDALSYRDLMRTCGELLDLKRPMLPIRFFAPALSVLWVSLITGAPQALVAPLVASLRHDMLVHDQRLARMAGLTPRSVREALTLALAERESTRDTRDKRDTHGTRSSPFRDAHGVNDATSSRVRSVQRMRLPKGRDAAWAADEYARWLPTALRGLVRVHVDAEGHCRFYLLFSRTPLLVLDHAPERSTRDRHLFFVSGGVLCRKGQRGRFELRQVLDDRTLLTAIHDFGPQLPWFLYRMTQARFHGWVMHAFAKHLAHARPSDESHAHA